MSLDLTGDAPVFDEPDTEFFQTGSLNSGNHRAQMPTNTSTSRQSSQASKDLKTDPSPEDLTKKGLAGLRVLVVEDEALIGFELVSELDSLGAEPVGPIATLADGMETAKQVAVDCAILDIRLHDVDVYPLADMLFEKNIPFVFHTGHGSREQLEADYPLNPVFTKPSNMNRMFTTLAALIATAKRGSG